MPARVQLTCCLTVLGLILAAGAERLSGSDSQTQPDGSFDPISLKAMEILGVCEKSVDLEALSQSPDAGELAWGESYVLLGYQAMYEGTGDQRYLKRLLEHIRRILANRGDRLGLRDEVRGKTMPAWLTSHYTEGKQHAFLVHAGMITYPMARLAFVLRRDPQLASQHGPVIEKILADVAQTVKAYEPEYRDGPGEGEGYYYCPGLRRDMPYNQQNALGRTIVAMYLATGDEWYRRRAEKLARYFKERLWLENGRYVWSYWAHSPGSEDISHAATNVDFAFDCYRAGIVFTLSDMKCFIGAFHHVARPDGFAGNVDGTGHGGILMGRWGRLGYIDPRVRQVLIDYLADHGQEDSIIALLAAGYLVETQRPFRSEQIVTAATRPAGE